MTYAEALKPHLTLANARAWKADSEKWMYVTDLINAADIGYDPQGDLVDKLVDYVEEAFDKLLEADNV